MGIALMAAVALAAFWALARNAADGGKGARAALIVWSLVVTAGAGLAVLLALLLWGLTCDESCDDGSTRWQDDPDAWQWGAQAGLAFVAFAAVAIALVFVLTRRYRGATSAMAVGAAGYGAWGVIFPII